MFSICFKGNSARASDKLEKDFRNSFTEITSPGVKHDPSQTSGQRDREAAWIAFHPKGRIRRVIIRSVVGSDLHGAIPICQHQPTPEPTDSIVNSAAGTLICRRNFERMKPNAPRPKPPAAESETFRAMSGKTISPTGSGLARRSGICKCPNAAWLKSNHLPQPHLFGLIFAFQHGMNSGLNAWTILRNRSIECEQCSALTQDVDRALGKLADSIAALGHSAGITGPEFERAKREIAFERACLSKARILLEKHRTERH
jgi:hypothetical protein